MHIYLRADIPPPPIKHRPMEHTALNKFHIEKNAQIPMADVPPPLIDHISMQHHYTKSVSHIAECTYTYGRHTPLQLTIDLWNTTTLNQFQI